MVNVSVQLEMLRQLLEEVKVLKADYVTIRYESSYGKYIALGTDPSVVFIKWILLKYDYKDLLVQGFNMKDLTTFMKLVENEDNVQIYGNTLVNLSRNMGVQIFDYRVDNLIRNSFDNTRPNMDNSLKRYDILTDNTAFNLAIAGKAGDGCSILNILGYPIAIYSSLLPINKGDVTELNIYDIKDEPTFIAEFTITKKKNVVVHALIRYLKV